MTKQERDQMLNQICCDFPQYNQYRCAFEALCRQIDALEQRLREARELLEQRSLWGDWSRVADGEVAISNYEQWSVWWEKVDTFLAKQP